jgi:predicted kinase
MDKTFLDFIDPVPLEEGINDPGIFKAVFLAGGPGSGKSFIVGQTGLQSFGLKLINSDDAFERALAKVGMEPSPDNIFSSKGQSIRDRAKLLTNKRQEQWIDGRLGLVIDGTGKDYQKISNQANKLRSIGYDVAMIFVNTDLETAQARNKSRPRTLPDKVVADLWKDVQNNIGRFQNLFGRYMFIVDNSDGANYQGATMSVYRRIGAWTREPVANHRARTWVKSQKKLRGIKEEDIGRNRTTMRNRIGKSSMQRKAEKRRAKLAQLAPKEPENKLAEDEVDEACWVGWKQQGMKKKGKRIVPNCVKEEELDEAPRWMLDPLAKTVHRNKYNVAKKILKQVYDRKKREGGGRTRHGIEWYALNVAGQVSDKIDARTLANMVKEEYDSDIHHWGTPEGTQHYKDMTPGQGDIEYKQNNSDDAVSDAPNEFEFSEVEILQMEDEINKMTFDDMVALGMYDEEELQDFKDIEEIPDFDLELEDELEEQVLDEVLSVQGRMKRRFAARRNRQKLKVARMRASRRAADPARIKKRAQRGARNVIKQRFARGRDVSKMPPQEKARIEGMAKRMAPLVARLAVRMMPLVRKNELQRIKKGGGGKPQAAKKFKITKGGSGSKYKAKKFKVKAPKKSKPAPKAKAKKK